MPDYRYLIIGGGMTADAAAGGIREVDPAGTIGLIGAEPAPPYNRPPLTKGLWKGEDLASIWRHTTDEGVARHLGRRVQSLDPTTKRAVDDQGTVYTYEQCLLATGGTPRRLPFGGDRVLYYRTLETYRRLRTLTDQRQRFAVVGGGFIGSELAAALAMNGKQVTMLFPDAGICARVFPADLVRFVTAYYREQGVEVLTGASVVGIEERGEALAVQARPGTDAAAQEYLVDGVVAGLGIRPNVELAQAAGLAVDNGILVDEALRTSDPNICAAGDVAAFVNPTLGQRMRVEHEDNANTMGMHAGHSMAGRGDRYDYLPSFYSDLFDLGYEAVGELDARLETVADWKEPFREGVVYYLREGRVRGVLLWNVWDQVDAARRLIAAPGPFRAADLHGRLPAAG
jgi:3-phenylpropionate/trans-cinnamate dioxygenase ferredoxin reductase component